MEKDIKSQDQKKQEKLPTREYFAQVNLKRLEETDKNIPQEMKEMQHWCVFKTYYDKTRGRRCKMILNCENGEWASSTDSASWSSFEKAMVYAIGHNCEGLAFALPRSGITCIDLDKCIDQNGKRSELAWDMLNNSKNTYAEKSVSNTGIHILFKGNFLDGYKTFGEGLEAFDNKFISLTGRLISSSNQLSQCSPSLQERIKSKLGKKEQEIKNRPGISHQTDFEIIDKIRNSKKGHTFDRLFAGENIQGNWSASDFTLLNILAYFTNCDSAQMERIFKSSGLYRPKKGQPYINLSIRRAIETLAERPDFIGKQHQKISNRGSER